MLFRKIRVITEDRGQKLHIGRKSGGYDLERDNENDAYFELNIQEGVKRWLASVRQEIL
jgi:hypothetical protein